MPAKKITITEPTTVKSEINPLYAVNMFVDVSLPMITGWQNPKSLSINPNKLKGPAKVDIKLLIDNIFSNSLNHIVNADKYPKKQVLSLRKRNSKIKGFRPCLNHCTNTNRNINIKIKKEKIEKILVYDRFNLPL